jgi:general secretion pathway protein F
MLLFAGLLALFFIARRLIKRGGKLQLQLHKLFLVTPIIKHHVKLVNSSRFLKTLSVMLGAGIPILGALQASVGLVSNKVIQNALYHSIDRIREGANVNLALKATGYFQPMSLHLIASGEASGDLSGMLEKAANNEENEIKRFIDVSLTLFEPLMILIMGGIVLFIVLAIMLPIFSMNELVN